jgi:two-component system response regulator PilR (NtrC family)
MSANYSLLVVDDEPDLRTLYELSLLREGYDVDSAGSVEEAWSRLAERNYSAVITDMRLPDGNGIDLLRRLEAAGRPEKAIVITAYGSAENAVEALKAGAFDYLTKPVDLRQFRTVVASALGRPMPAVPEAPTVRPPGGGGRTAGRAAPPAPPPEPAAAGSPVPHPALQRLAGESLAMQQVRSLIERVARSQAPVHIQGESGTGKELVARLIHQLGPRGDGPFVPVNCGAIPSELMESEFFGHRKGSFSGAVEDKPGLFQAASGGTLFLDEVADLPLPMQVKLLRAIQEKRVRAIGAQQEQPVDTRILSATHKNLRALIEQGLFRDDLYYRINVIELRVPSLRERVEDIPQLAHELLARIALEYQLPPPELTSAAIERLCRHGFPGNVRELENILERAFALCEGERIEAADLGLGDDGGNDSDWQALEARAPAVPALPAVGAAPLPSDLVAHLDGVERDIIIRALELHRFNRTAAGSSLGLSLRQMRYRMARLGIQVAEHGPE